MEANRKKAGALAMCAVMLSAAVAGGTLAYLTSEDSDVNVMTLGNVDIMQSEYQRDEDASGNPTLDFFIQHQELNPAYVTDESAWTPDTPVKVSDDMWINMWGERVVGDIDKIVTVTNLGKTDAYVRTIIAVPLVGANGEGIHLSDMMAGYYASESDAASKTNRQPTMMGNAWQKVDPVEIDGQSYELLVATYLDPLASGETSAPSLTGVAFDSSVTNEDLEKFEDGTLNILVYSQAVQAPGWKDANNNGTAADEALDAAHGAITAESHPWSQAKIVKSSEELISALKSAKEGDVIILTSSTYDLGSEVSEIPAGITIEGSGDTVVRVSAQDGTILTVKDGAVLRGLHFDVDGNAKVESAEAISSPAA